MSKFTTVVVGLLAVLLVVLAVWTGVRRSRAQQPAACLQQGGVATRFVEDEFGGAARAIA